MLRFDHVIRGSDKDVYINGNVAFMELPFQYASLASVA